MANPVDGRLRLPLGNLAAFLAILSIQLRWLVAGETAGTGINIFIHLMAWLAAACWFCTRVVGGESKARFAGSEAALFAFLALCIVSLLRAPYFMPAFDLTLAYLSYGILFFLAMNAIGGTPLLRLFSATTFTLSIYGILQYGILLPALADSPGLTSGMAGRIAQRDVFATFLYPNTFAGFLALAVPLQFGLWIDARGRGKLWHGSACALGIVAMALTGSRGGWAALAAGMVAFAALAATRSRGRHWAIAGAAVLVLLAGVFSGPAIRWAAERNSSMRSRQVYWTAAVRTGEQAPLLGVGLDNFQEYYPQFKPDTPLETRKAHNDYLQIFTETGFLGLLALATFLALGFGRTLASDDPYPSSDDPPIPSWIMPSAGALAFLMAYFLTNSLSAGDTIVLVVLAAAWQAFLAGGQQPPPAAGRPFTRIGLAAGMAAVLLHMAVDFDLYDMGVAMTIFLAPALAALLRGSLITKSWPRWAFAAAAAVFALASLPILTIVAPRAIAAEDGIERARLALDEFDKRPDTKLLSDALRFTEAARTDNPMAPDACEMHAQARFRLWRRLAGEAAPTASDLQAAEEDALKSLDRAIRLRPQSSWYPALKSRFRRAFRLFHLKQPGGSAAAAEHLRFALEEQRLALRLYPSLAENQYAMARLLDMSDDEGAARAGYTEALRLSDLAALEPEYAHRQLDPIAHARCLHRLGGEEAARKWLIASLKESADRSMLEEFRRRPPLSGDEDDETMRSVIRDALDAILKQLPEGK